MKALERRQSLLELLCERRFEKIDNLAFEFSVNECTIRRDIQELSLSYPIYTVTGPYGGVYVSEDYYLGKSYLSPEQMSLLEEVSNLLDETKKKTLNSIIKKFGRPNIKEIKNGYRTN